jgi:hypothetical protein
LIIMTGGNVISIRRKAQGIPRRRLAVGCLALVATTGTAAAGGGAASASAGTRPGSGPVNIATLLKHLPKPPAQIKGTRPSAAPVLGQQVVPLVKVNPDGTLNPDQPSPAGCRFQPSATGGTPGTIQNAHISASVPGAVKVNSYIVCNTPVDALANETNLYKLGFLGLISELQASTVTDNAGQAVLPNLGTFVNCTSTANSTFYGDAYGISEENGQLYEGYGVSPSNTTLPCGTP